MSTARQLEGTPVRLAELRIGDLLAEGGEGKVYQLPLQPHLVFKSYRRPVAPSVVEDMVSWPVCSLDEAGAATLRASAAWPVSTVLDESSAVAGLLVPRAPKRFSLRHRDGATRLASLSYLTTDPAQRRAAYGIQLPEPVATERFGLVYALARLLDALDSGRPRVGHGDLSTKNVLWSLQRGPEVFVIDCDNCARFDAAGDPLGDSRRRRAMTPNWDDPAVAPGANPSVESDRYSLALIFLRVVGAANYPIQARQRSGDPVTVEFPVPSWLRSASLLDPGAPLWELCGRGLSLDDPTGRPPASAWVGVLEAVLDSIGGAHTMRAVWAAQGGGRPSAIASLPVSGPADVEIRPVEAAGPHGARDTWGFPIPSWARDSETGSRAAAVRPAAIRTANGGIRRPTPVLASTWPVLPGTPGSVRPAAQPLTPEIVAAVVGAVRWWVHTHRRTLHTVVNAGGRRQRTRALAFCAAVDAAIAVALVFVAGMVVSPFLGI